MKLGAPRNELGISAFRVFRFRVLLIAAVAQLVEHVLGKDEVKGSSPLSSFAAWMPFN